MRPNLNNAVTFLRELRHVIPDELIEGIAVTDVICINLRLPSEEFIANFGTTHLPDARVERIEQDTGVVWRATFTYRKRSYVVNLRVDPTIGLPAREIFSSQSTVT